MQSVGNGWRMGRERTGQNLHEVAPGRWKVTVNLPASMTGDGQRHRRVEYVYGGKRDADRRRRQLLTERDEGRLKPRAPGTVQEFLETWLAGKKTGVAARTHQRWEGLIRVQIAPHIGAMKLRDIKPATIRKLYADLRASGLRGTTVQKVHALLRQAFKQGVIDGDLPANPCAVVAAPTIDTPEAQALDVKQAADLLAKLAGTPLHTPVLVTLDAGLRRGELLALRWRDLDLKGGLLTVSGAVEEVGAVVTVKGTKTGRVRRVRLTRRAIAALRTHKREQAAHRLTLADRWQDQGLIFPATDEHRGKSAGRVWRPSSFSRAFRDATKAVGYEIGLHTLRHTHATLMLRAGRPAREVAERLGHSTTKLTTDTYSHILPDQQREGVAAFERLFGDH